jgi:serine/threonine protein phosphatase PrpC
MAEFTVRSGSVVGSEHLLRAANNQDKYRYSQFVVGGRPYAVGVVCDGCSEGQHSEVGAALLAEFLTRRAEKLLHDGFQVAEVPDLLYHWALQFLKSLSGWLIGTDYNQNELTSLAKDYLLATVVGFIVGDEHTVIFSAGDGLILVNGHASVLNQDNRPAYLAYDILNPAHLTENRVRTSFETQIYATSAIERLAIWTDGFDPALAHELAELSSHPRALQRKLNVWANQKRFHDDTTGILLEVNSEQ